MRRTLALCAVMLTATTAPVLASRLGLGVGFCELGFGGGELWAEFRPEQSLTWRLSLVYLAPLLPLESPGVGFLGGLRLAGGEGMRPFLTLAGGTILERTNIGGPAIGWLASSTAGLEWFSPGWALYLGASAYLALRSTTMGTVFYPYFIYCIGLAWGR